MVREVVKEDLDALLFSSLCAIINGRKLLDMLQ